MSFRKISFAPEEYYHIYNRGNSKQEIFLDEKDYARFLALSFLCNTKQNINFRDTFDTFKNIYDFEREETLVDIGSYCLMPNHFHLLIREKSDGNISLYMKKLATAYVMYFNKKYGRSGSLFEGKFKSQHAESDRYLKYLFSYINLNPIKLIEPNWKKNIIKNKLQAYNFARDYKYSSFYFFENKNKDKKDVIININSFPKYFSNLKEFKEEIFDWLSFPEERPREMNV